jgi:hypothetical protein
MTGMPFDKGENPNAKKQGRAKKNHKAVAGLLFSHGTDVQAKDYDGRIPLTV